MREKVLCRSMSSIHILNNQRVRVGISVNPDPARRIANLQLGPEVVLGIGQAYQATASWFVDEYGTCALNGITTMLGHGHSARGTGHILVGEVQCSCECQMCALFHSDPLDGLAVRRDSLYVSIG